MKKLHVAWCVVRLKWFLYEWKCDRGKWHGVMHTNDIMWRHTAYDQETHVIRCHNKCYYEQKYHVKGFNVMYICRQQWCHEGAIWHIHKILCIGWLHNTLWKWTIKLSLVYTSLLFFAILHFFLVLSWLVWSTLL